MQGNKIPLKKLEEDELTAIYELAQLGGSVPSHKVMQLLSHIEMLKCEVAMSIALIQCRKVVK